MNPSARAPVRSLTRAIAHARRLAPALLAGLLLAACGGGKPEGAAAGSAPGDDPAALARARERLQELVRLVQPPDPLWTSDRKDQQLMASRSLMRELCASPSPATAAAALALFEELPADDPRGRAAVLEVAGHADSARAVPLLKQLVRRYDPETGLFVRTEAARILSDVAPAEAVQLFGQILSGPVNTTLPPPDLLVRYWAAAAHRLGDLDPELLTDIATDLKRPADMRYAAIEELGRVHHPRSAAALRTLLVESGSDGYLRRKAAQSLVNLLPPEEYCPLLREVADKESDATFLVFLADLLERNCE